jgi:hypothetical protein
MKVYGNLEQAQLEALSASPTPGILGRIFINNVTLIPGYDNGTVIKYFADLNSVQSLSNKTLVGATADLFTLSHQATPSNPSAGFVKVYVKSNNKAYILRSSGVESALGGGGGAGSLLWEKNGVINPTTEYLDGFHLENFANGDTQEIYALLTVPESYEAGTQLKLLYGAFFMSATVGKVFFKCETALIRDGSTVLGTYSNVHTSTNLEVDAPAVANTLKAIGEIDLTSAIGQINGVALAPGDKLRVRLFRDNAAESSPANADAKLLINNFQLRFTV